MSNRFLKIEGRYLKTLKNKFFWSENTHKEKNNQKMFY